LFIDGWIRSRNWQPKTRGFYIDGGTGYAEFTNVYVTGTITAATLLYGKTSFTDSIDGGYFISPLGIYIGAANDTTRLKYTVADGTFDFIGTISSRSTATVAAAIDVNGQLITTRLNTATKQILDGFKFTTSGALNISGTQTALTVAAAVGAVAITVTDTTGFPSAGVFYLQGDVNWMRITYTGKTGTTLTGIPASSTGSITEIASIGNQVIGGPGILITPKGLVGLNSTGVETFTINGQTGDATFSGTITGSTITGGTIQTAGSGQRVIIAASDNTLRFFDSASQVIGIGSTTATAIRLDLNTVTTSGIQIVGVTGSSIVGYSYDNANNVLNRGFDISMTGTTNNSASAVNIVNTGSGELIFGDVQGTGNGITISRGTGTGTAPLISLIDTIGTSGQSLRILKSNSTGTSNMVEFSSDDGGITLYAENTKSTSGKPVVKIVSASSSASSPALHIVKNNEQYAVILEQTVNSGGNTIGFKMNIANSGAGVEYAFEFAGSEYDGTKTSVSTVTGVIKILTSDGAVFIPVYATAS
jgi:hypothetical protein